MQKPLCVYHGNCADGFTAAWVVHRYFNGEVELYPGVYNKPFDAQVTGRRVIFVDFAYKREAMHNLLRCGPESVLILDHHKSACEDLRADGGYIIDTAAYQGVMDYARFGLNVALDYVEGGPRIYTYFDMQRSGAGIAWDFFFPGLPRPLLLNHVEDRDLWKFKYPDTRAVQANLFSYPYELEVWSRLMTMDHADLAVFAREGTAIERKHHKDIAELLAVTTRRLVIGGVEVPAANLPYTLVSDAAGKLAESAPFAACYWDTPSGRTFGLRSRPPPDGIDVAKIAEQYGGGGHRSAAGFSVTFAQAAEMEVGAARQRTLP